MSSHWHADKNHTFTEKEAETCKGKMKNTHVVKAKVKTNSPWLQNPSILPVPEPQ